MNRRLGVRLLTFMVDFIGEGVDQVLSRIAEAGVDGVTVAMAYHTARDVFPHNPMGQVLYHEGGTMYCEPGDVYQTGPLKPVEAELTRGTHLSDTVIERARDLGLGIGAWVVVFHNTRLASQHPEFATETAAGDRLLHSLCPSNPATRAYALSLIEDIASRGFDHMLMESLSFMPFDHGYHHERALLGLDARTRLLLGLCFCLHCTRAGETTGTDVSRLRDWVLDDVRQVLDHREALSDLPADREWAWGACDGELGRYLTARINTVSSLAQSAAVRSAKMGVESVAFIDPSGAALGYATGIPATEDRAVDIAWRDGIAPERISEVMDVAVTAYFAEPDRLAVELDGYLEMLASTDRLHAILRPMTPDTPSGADLLPKMEVLSSEGVDVVSFYHYGLMRLESIDWIRGALTAMQVEKGD